ncbi:MAG: M48 family metalloprotease [Methanothrix sp.]|nr:M48 family metalloprotease [Methanothrix sp.]
MKKELLTFLLSCIVLGGCATTSLAPISKDTVLEEDEKRLWKRASEEQHDLDRSGLLYKDEALERYVNDVARKIQPPEIYAVIPFKVKVIKNPYLNAFALPNGAVYVHTGILARMDNEAQLATLLAHEMTHATNRHSVISFRGVKNKSAVVASLQGTIGAVPLVGDMVTSLGALGATSSVYGHSRELESEADTVGLRLMVQAGYDPREAPKLFLHMKKELEEEKITEPFFFGTHPRLEDRVDNFESLLKKQYVGQKGILNRETFLKKTQKMILDNAQLDLKAGRFSVAQRGIEKYLTAKPNDAHAYYLLGEVSRQRGEKGDMEKAKEHYQKAASLDSSYCEPNKGIGMIYLKQGNEKLAVKYFKTYLSLAPDASDRKYIEEYIK